MDWIGHSERARMPTSDGDALDRNGRVPRYSNEGLFVNFSQPDFDLELSRDLSLNITVDLQALP